MFNVVGLDIFFKCNLFLFIVDVNNPDVIHGSLLIYFLVSLIGFFGGKLVHVPFVCFV